MIANYFSYLFFGSFFLTAPVMGDFQFESSELNAYIDCINNPYSHLEECMTQARYASSFLPQTILNVIENFKMNQREDGYLYFKYLPVDAHLPETPAEQSSFPPTNKNSFVSEFCLCLFASTLGEPFNYIQEERGNIFRNIRPTKKNATEQTSDSSKVNLELHTETAFHPFKPDYLLLYCLRGDRNHKAYTLVSSLKKIIPQLDAQTVEELRKNQFLIGIDVSFGNKEKNQFYDELIPVLYGNGEDCMITYDLDLMKATTASSQEALHRLKEAIEKVQEKVMLESGDLLIIDNRRAIHGRTAYEPLFDGYDRWLQRVYVSVNPDFAARILQDGRVIKKQFN